MKKFMYLAIAIIWFSMGVAIDVRNTVIVNRLQRDNRILMENNINLIRLNEGLSKGLGDIADKLIEKAEWDKKVAEKIRELDSLVKGTNGQSNQGISETIH